MAWHLDQRMLAAGNARSLPGGDPLAMEAAPSRPQRLTPKDVLVAFDGVTEPLTLDGIAARLGVDKRNIFAQVRELVFRGRLVTAKRGRELAHGHLIHPPDAIERFYATPELSEEWRRMIGPEAHQDHARDWRNQP